MVVEGNLRCITNNTKIGCGWNEPIGTTQDEIAKAKAKAKADAEAEAEARAIELKAFAKATADAKKNREILEEKIRKGEDPPFRIGEYLESNIRNEFQRDGDYHIYLIELEEPLFRTSCTFPNSEYPPNTDFDSAAGYVWIGIANMGVVENFRRLVRRNDSSPNIRVMHEHKTSPDFEICGRALTEQYGITGVKTSDNADFLQAWLGWALYKAGYWVWLGPTTRSLRGNPAYKRKLAMDNIGSYPFL